MKTFITKFHLESNGKRKLQLKISQDEIDPSVLNICKGDKAGISLENRQKHVDEKTGEITQAQVVIATESIAISVLVLNDGQIWMVTLSFQEKDDQDQLIEALIGQPLCVEFLQ